VSVLFENDYTTNKYIFETEKCDIMCPALFQPTSPSYDNCRQGIEGVPAFGGLDVVNYFTKFKLSNGSYDESKVGVAGSEDHVVTYKSIQ
jgi:hypothetical protein